LKDARPFQPNHLTSTRARAAASKSSDSGSGPSHEPKPSRIVEGHDAAGGHPNDHVIMRIERLGETITDREPARHPQVHQ
jgi:hypothetical protein